MMRYLLSMVFITGIGVFLRAQEVKTLGSVEQALELAKANNPDLEIFQLQVEQAQIEMKAAKLHRLPTVTASFSGQNNRSLATTPLPGEIFGQPGEVVDAQFGQPYNYNAGITVSKSVLDVGNKVKARMSTVEHVLQNDQQASYEQQLAFQTAYYYYALLIAQKAATLNKQDVAIADSLLVLTRKKREKGLVNEPSYIQAQILANNARENLSSSMIRQKEYELQLKLLLGQPRHLRLHLEEELDTAAISELSMELGRDQELLAAQTEVDLADLRVKYQRSNFLPKLSLESYFGQQQFRDDFGLSLQSNDWSTYSYLGVSLYVPLFTGFTNKNNLKSAKVAHQIASKRLKVKEVNSSYQDQLVLQNFIGGKDRVSFARENFELYQLATQLSLQQYEQGLIGLNEYLSKFEDQLKAEQHYLNALTTLFNYYATIISRSIS